VPAGAFADKSLVSAPFADLSPQLTSTFVEGNAGLPESF
jgi:hypothetical protein